MNKTPEVLVPRSTFLGPAGGHRRATRLEIFGRRKGRRQRLHLPSESIACRHEDGARTEVLRIGSRFIVETRSPLFRSKRTFPTERAALDFFHAEDAI